MNKSNFQSLFPITKEQLLSNNPNLQLIPISEINIEKDPSKTVGYDFTVKDNYTFATNDGVMLMDCMSIYFPITDESIKDANEKISIWSNLVSPSDNNVVAQPSQDVVLGIYSGTKKQV